MAQNYSLIKAGLLGLGLLGASGGAGAQTVAPAAEAAPLPPRLLLKAGLRVTHFSYSSGNQTWRVVVPVSFGAEYRIVPRLAFYGQAEADVQASRTATRRRPQTNALPSATLGLGLRYYYNQPGKGELRRNNNLYGNYLALEGNVARETVVAGYANVARRQTPTSLTPGVYAFWGTQHRLRRAMLYDLNAGLGLQAPAYYNFESLKPTHYDVAAQVNIRLYWGLRL
ncbi:MAG: hypothetical protein EOO62_32385 [Hymenobacter sp.]|nr:MAG: hypothetical protein EOO62_32385 [Hymenobacter sp.]